MSETKIKIPRAELIEWKIKEEIAFCKWANIQYSEPELRRKIIKDYDLRQVECEITVRGDK